MKANQIELCTPSNTLSSISRGMRVLLTICAAVLMAGFFSACIEYDRSPVSAPGHIAGTARYRMVVERPYSQGLPGSVSYPAGRYVAEYSDAHGTYYAAPTRVTAHFIGVEPMEGGFYVPRGNPFGIRAYLHSSYDRSPFKLSAPVEGLVYHFERTSVGKKKR